MQPAANSFRCLRVGSVTPGILRLEHQFDPAKISLFCAQRAIIDAASAIRSSGKSRKMNLIFPVSTYSFLSPAKVLGERPRNADRSKSVFYDGHFGVLVAERPFPSFSQPAVTIERRLCCPL